MTKKRIKEIKKEIEELREAYAESVSKKLNEFFSEFLQSYENIEAIRWEQYTQYFNDGEECTFSIQNPYFKENGAKDFVNYWDMESEDQYAKLMETSEKLREFLEEIEMELEHAFGDHKCITVTRKGIEVEDYTNHD